MTRRPRAVALAVLGVTAGCGGGHELVGITRDPAPQVDAIALPDLSQDGAPFELRAAPGELLVVFFGYTNCPDICPTTMADLARARAELGDDADRVDVAMVTVDPDRDAAVLTDYVQGFVPDAHALATTDTTALRTVAESFGVAYDVEKSASGRVDVGHSSYVFVVDAAGTLVLTWRFGTSAADIAADLDALLSDA